MRWTPLRRKKVVDSVLKGFLSFDQTCALHDLSVEELSEWVSRAQAGERILCTRKSSFSRPHYVRTLKKYAIREYEPYRKQLEELAARGLRTKQIAFDLQLSHSHVSQLARGYNIKIKGQRRVGI